MAEKLVIAGGHLVIGVGNGIRHGSHDQITLSYYHKMVARGDPGAVESHYKEVTYIYATYNRAGRARSSRAPPCAGDECVEYLTCRTFGVDRMNAILPGIFPPTRSMYGSGRKQWKLPKASQNKPLALRERAPIGAMASLTLRCMSRVLSGALLPQFPGNCRR